MKTITLFIGLAVFYFAMRDMPTAKVSISSCGIRMQDPHQKMLVSL